MWAVEEQEAGVLALRSAAKPLPGGGGADDAAALILF